MDRLRIIILALLWTMLGLGVVSVVAQSQDAARAQVAAATANAINGLKSEILSTRMVSNLTVAQFLTQTDSMDALTATVERAQQIGGPRWVDDHTCQVKLEISGTRIATALVSVAAARPRLSPVPAAVLQRQLEDWKDRSFSATGTSVSADRIIEIRPAEVGPRWSGVSDEARTQAITAARRDAAQHVLDDIRPINLGPGQSMGDLISHEPVQQAVRDWVTTRPVTQLRYNDNLEVELTVSTPPDELFQTVITSARSTAGTTFPSDEKGMEQLKQEFERRVSVAVGRAGVVEKPAISTQPPPPAPAFELPGQPPMWTSQPIDVEGTASASKSPLRTKSAAEADATNNLRDTIGTLPIKHDLTIGQAIKQDPRIGEAVNRALLRARVYKVDYRADGSVVVRMSIDSRDLWEEFRMIAGQ